EGQRAEQDGVDGGENSAVGADAECESENDGKREGWKAADEAEGGFEIGDCGFDEVDAVDVAQLLFDLFAATEGECGLAAGFFGRHARSDIFDGELVDVKVEFGVELRVGARGSGFGRSPEHGRSYSAVCRICVTAADSRRQLDSSACNCLRPLAESL